jgi:multifunctional methyltransferase subunit TRM112
MRLLTHNYLQSNVKGTEKGYPLLIEPTKLEYEESPFNPDFVKALLSKINYEGLLFAQRQIAEKCTADLSNEFQMPELPETLDENVDETVLKNLHDVMFDIHVVEGALICPDTGRRFMINMGIPNMILHEDEI